MKYFTIQSLDPGIIVKVLKGVVIRTPFKLYLKQKEKEELSNLLRIQCLKFKVEEITEEEYTNYIKNKEEINKKIPKSKYISGAGNLNLNLKING